MRILFIQDNVINESLILMEVSSYLKMHGHQTFLLIEQEEKQLEKEIIGIDPDIFIIPCYQFSLPWVLGVVKRIRKISEKKIALAGIVPTLLPEIINNYDIDIIFRGEVEEAILEALDSLDDGEKLKHIENVVVKGSSSMLITPLRRPYPSLDELPLPDRDLYYRRYRILRNIGLKRFISGRGCIHNCSFCYNSYLKEIYGQNKTKQNFIRRKSPQRVVEEIRYVKERYPLKHVHFSDDLFCIDERWIESFCEAYKRSIGVPFTLNAAVDLLNERVIKRLKEAHCQGIAIGVETGNEDLRFKVMNKKITNSQIQKIAAIIKEHNLRLITFNMIANPTETIDDAIRTIKLNRKIKSDCARVLIASPIPHTNYTRLGLQEKLFSKGELFAFFTTSNPEYIDRVFFQGEEKDSWLILRGIFYVLVKLPLPGSFIKRVISIRRNKFLDNVLKLLQFLRLLDERKVFGLNYREALCYYLHTKNPSQSRKNVYPSFV